MKKLGIFVIMILCLTSVLAFQATVEAINDEIFPGETAVYLLTVENDGETEDDLKLIFSEDTRWSIITKPIYHQTSYKISPGEQIVTTVSITPDESLDYGQQYEYSFAVGSNLNNFKRFVSVDLFLRSPDRLSDYIPIVEVDVDVDSALDPRDEGQMFVTLKNFNRLNITDLLITIESEIEPRLNQELSTTLAGLEEKQLIAKFKYNDLEKPTTDTITVRGYITSRNKTLDPKTKKLEILPYNEVAKDENIMDGFLKTQTVYSYYNDGNVMTSVNLEIQTSLFQQIFTRADPKPSISKEGGYRKMIWSFSLDAQGTNDISVTRNYRPLFIFIVIIILVLILYYVFRSPIIIKKQAMNETHQGDTSRLKVLLHVKNRTGRIVDNVNVSDRIPRIADLDANYPVGTMQPSKVIKHDKRGTIIKWIVPTLEAYEERIITYHINSKLKIVGSMRLPNSMVKYKNKMGKFSKVYSSKVSAE